MSRRFVSALLAVTAGLAAIATPASAESPAVSPRANALDILILEKHQPLRLELQVDVDGQSIPAIWDETFAALLKFHDRNGDGNLDPLEAARLPTSFALRQALWGVFASLTQNAPKFEQLDLSADGKVDAAELSDFYRRAGLGGVLVGLGQPSGSEQLTQALLLRLDTNKNSRVDEAEWKIAADTLRSLDQNDDELIGPGELVEKASYPGALGAILLSAPAPTHQPSAAIEALPLRILPIRLADQHWISSMQARRNVDQSPPFSAQLLESLRTAKPAAVWQVSILKRPEGEVRSLRVAGQDSSQKARLAFSSDRVRLELRMDEGKLPEQAASARKRVMALFADCDTDSNSTLDATELAAPRAAQIATLASTADRNSDGTWDQPELTGWLDLQDQLAKGCVLLTLIDRGQGLFELLDAEHDGSLSVRELKSAWSRLNDAGVIVDGMLDRAKVPWQILATVSHGHPQTTVGNPQYQAPDWFRAMDRNNDGDLSRREFNGSSQIFDRLDQDHDGLIDAEEAAVARAK